MTLEEWMSFREFGDAAVADLVGVDRATISKLRRGKKRPSIRLMDEFVRATNGSVMPNDWLPPHVHVAAAE